MPNCTLLKNRELNCLMAKECTVLVHLMYSFDTVYFGGNKQGGLMEYPPVKLW